VNSADSRLTLDLLGLRGWQLLFILEAVPALLFGIVLWFWLKDWPQDAPWLSDPEKQYLAQAYDREVAEQRIRRH